MVMKVPHQENARRLCRSTMMKLLDSRNPPSTSKQRRTLSHFQSSSVYCYLHNHIKTFWQVVHFVAGSRSVDVVVRFEVDKIISFLGKKIIRKRYWRCRPHSFQLRCNIQRRKDSSNIKVKTDHSLRRNGAESAARTQHQQHFLVGVQVYMR